MGLSSDIGDQGWGHSKWHPPTCMHACCICSPHLPVEKTPQLTGPTISLLRSHAWVQQHHRAAPTLQGEHCSTLSCHPQRRVPSQGQQLWVGGGGACKRITGTGRKGCDSDMVQSDGSACVSGWYMHWQSCCCYC